ncbi:MAG TPA: hypothetical protein VG895_00040 [Patescibacteria group bacterium]|nr:hypothetical protein [Gammaproteobacteria bacterium]HWA51432.1 hypothetical protein [Patescibacteria group bacterium]
MAQETKKDIKIKQRKLSGELTYLEDFKCPISLGVILNDRCMVAEDGHTYSERNIKNWFMKEENLHGIFSYLVAHRMQEKLIELMNQLAVLPDTPKYEANRIDFYNTVTTLVKSNDPSAINFFVNSVKCLWIIDNKLFIGIRNIFENPPLAADKSINENILKPLTGKVTSQGEKVPFPDMEYISEHVISLAIKLNRPLRKDHLIKAYDDGNLDRFKAILHSHLQQISPEVNRKYFFEPLYRAIQSNQTPFVQAILATGVPISGEYINEFLLSPILHG